MELRTSFKTQTVHPGNQHTKLFRSNASTVPRVYLYVVDRDFGFAPNPFHGVCSLATCKPGIRRRAEVGDWIIGIGGRRMKSTGKCVFAMKVSRAISFNEYWASPEFLDKKPVRNGSSKMMVGDNIYYRDSGSKAWNQADSHHSKKDGSVNRENLEHDTQTDRVLLSNHFFYFGAAAPTIPGNLLETLGYQNGRNYRVFAEDMCQALIAWLENSFKRDLNSVKCDPMFFDSSEKRFSIKRNQIL